MALKTDEILDVLAAIAEVRAPETRLHLLGVTRCERIPEFATHGVTSFDSTSPFRQAFKDDRDNYYTLDRTCVALRVPQVDGNAKLQRRIRAGEVDQALARRLERAALGQLAAFDRGRVDVEPVVAALREYEALHDEKRDRSEAYRDVLDAAAVEGVRLRGVRAGRHPGDHLPRHRAQQAPRVPQPARLREAT